MMRAAYQVAAVPEQENSLGPMRPPEEVHDWLWLVRLRQPVASRATARSFLT